MDIRQAKVPSGVAIGQCFMIKAQKVKNGRLKVMDMNRVFRCLEAEWIGSTMNMAPLDAAPC